MNRGRGRGRNRGMLYLLAMQVASEFYQMDWKPPVTAALIGANTLIYLRPGVLDDLLPSLSEGIQLERTMGSTKFASAVVMLLGMSHGIEVVLAKMLATFFDYPDYYLSECSVGFSAVLFALKVILSSDSQGYTNVYGLVVPARHAAWTELILIQMFVPGVSFLGHLSGIIAGLLYLWARRFSSRSNPFTPMLRKFTWFLGLPRRMVQRYLNRYRRQTYGRGTVGGGLHAVWRCPACTFDNNVHLEVCEICGTRRGNTNFSPLAPPLSQTETRISSRDLSLDELRRRRLDRFRR